MFKPDLIYITLSPHGPAFIKDSILVYSQISYRNMYTYAWKELKMKVEHSKIKKYITK